VAERVSVVELHHPAPRPGPIRRRPGIALHRGHLVAPAGESCAGEQAGRARTDDGYTHDNHRLRYTDNVVTALTMHPIRRDVKGWSP
jgi:hypothetical protein